MRKPMESPPVSALVGEPGWQIIGPRFRLVNEKPSEASSSGLSSHCPPPSRPSLSVFQVRSQTSHPSCVLSEFLTHSVGYVNKIDIGLKEVV